MARAVLLDIDGVLTVSWAALPGTVAAIRWLQDEGIDFRLVTNTSSRSRREITALLSSAGMSVDPSHVLTAVTSASLYLTEHFPDANCLIVNEGDLREDLGDVRSGETEPFGAVLLGGAGPSVGYEQLNAAFRLALDGVPLVGLHRNTRFQTADGLSLDMGAFIVGLEAAAHVDVEVVGKPAAAFFHAALSDLGVAPSDTVMVGDDIESDVLGVQALGITGVLVKTGKFRPSDLEGGSGRPDQVIDGIGDLADLIERIR